jgi:hypothetical protein
MYVVVFDIPRYRRAGGGEKVVGENQAGVGSNEIPCYGSVMV